MSFSVGNDRLEVTLFAVFLAQYQEQLTGEKARSRPSELVTLLRFTGSQGNNVSGRKLLVQRTLGVA